MNHTNLIHKKKSSQIVYSISVYVQKEIKNESSSVYVFDMESSVSWNIQAARFHTSSSGTSCNKNLNLWCKQTEAIQPDMYQHQLWRGIWFLRENISSFAQHRDTAVRSRRRFLCLNESVTNITKYQKINAAAAAHVSQRGNRLLQAFSFITHDPNFQKEASCIFSKQCSTNRSSASTSVSHRAAANSLSPLIVYSITCQQSKLSEAKVTSSGCLKTLILLSENKQMFDILTIYKIIKTVGNCFSFALASLCLSSCLCVTWFLSKTSVCSSSLFFLLSSNSLPFP